jgi:predicted RNA binding protein YcfA (HicA-like mRNA interferase family)
MMRKKDVISILQANGWEIEAGKGKGSHTIYRKPGHLPVCIPTNAGKDLPRGILKSIENASGLSLLKRPTQPKIIADVWAQKMLRSGYLTTNSVRFPCFDIGINRTYTPYSFVDELVHIGQTHRAPLLGTNEPTRRAVEEVARSQFKVSQTILTNQGYPVVGEGHDCILLPAEQKNRVYALFPQGELPGTYSELNTLQKRWLHDFGASQTLLALNKIPYIYPSQSVEMSNKITLFLQEIKQNPRYAISQDGSYFVNTTREKEALSWVRKLAEDNAMIEVTHGSHVKNQMLINSWGNSQKHLWVRDLAFNHPQALSKQSILLIYGSLHDFSPHLREGERYKFINTSIESPINAYSNRLHHSPPQHPLKTVGRFVAHQALGIAPLIAGHAAGVLTNLISNKGVYEPSLITPWEPITAITTTGVLTYKMGFSPGAVKFNVAMIATPYFANYFEGLEQQASTPSETALFGEYAGITQGINQAMRLMFAPITGLTVGTWDWATHLPQFVINPSSGYVSWGESAAKVTVDEIISSGAELWKSAKKTFKAIQSVPLKPGELGASFSLKGIPIGMIKSSYSQGVDPLINSNRASSNILQQPQALTNSLLASREHRDFGKTIDHVVYQHFDIDINKTAMPTQATYLAKGIKTLSPARLPVKLFDINDPSITLLSIEANASSRLAFSLGFYGVGQLRQHLIESHPYSAQFIKHAMRGVLLGREITQHDLPTALTNFGTTIGTFNLAAKHLGKSFSPTLLATSVSGILSDVAEARMGPFSDYEQRINPNSSYHQDLSPFHKAWLNEKYDQIEEARLLARIVSSPWSGLDWLKDNAHQLRVTLEHTFLPKPSVKTILHSPQNHLTTLKTYQALSPYALLSKPQPSGIIAKALTGNNFGLPLEKIEMQPSQGLISRILSSFSLVGSASATSFSPVTKTSLVLPSERSSTSSFVKYAIASKNTRPTQCIILSGPRQEHLTAKELSDAFKTQGLQCKTIGDGIQHLNNKHLEQLYQSVEEAKGKTLLVVNAQGYSYDVHGWFLGYNFRAGSDLVLSTDFILYNISKKLKGRPIEIFDFGCYGGDVAIRSRKILPENAVYASIAKENQFSILSHQKSFAIALRSNLTPNDLSVDNLLKIYLTHTSEIKGNDRTITVGNVDFNKVNPHDQSTPLLCKPSMCLDLEEQLVSLLGKKPSGKQKDYVLSKLNHQVDTHTLDSVMKAIESHSKELHNNTYNKKFNIALAITNEIHNLNQQIKIELSERIAKSIHQYFGINNNQTPPQRLAQRTANCLLQPPSYKKSFAKPHKPTSKTKEKNMNPQPSVRTPESFFSNLNRQFEQQKYEQQSLKNMLELMGWENKQIGQDILNELKPIAIHIESQVEELRKQKSFQETRDIYMGIHQAFGGLSMIGQLRHNQDLVLAGNVLQQGTLIAMSVGQLTGTMGFEVAATGWAALNPYVTLAIASVSLIAMAMGGGDNNNGLGEALQQISSQINRLHQAMLENFNIVFKNQKIILDSIIKLHGYIEHDFKLPALQKLNEIESNIQNLQRISGAQINNALTYHLRDLISKIEGNYIKDSYVAKLANWMIKESCQPSLNGLVFAHQAMTAKWFNQVLQDEGSSNSCFSILGFIAHAVKKRVNDFPADIDINQLPNAPIWTLSARYLMPLLIKAPENQKNKVYKEIMAQGEHILRFLDYIRTNHQIFKLLLTEYQTSIEHIQVIIANKINRYEYINTQLTLNEALPTGSGDRTLLDIELAQVDAAYNLIHIICLLSRLPTPEQAITDVKLLPSSKLLEQKIQFIITKKTLKALDSWYVKDYAQPSKSIIPMCFKNSTDSELIFPSYGAFVYTSDYNHFTLRGGWYGNINHTTQYWLQQPEYRCGIRYISFKHNNIDSLFSLLRYDNETEAYIANPETQTVVKATSLKEWKCIPDKDDAEYYETIRLNVLTINGTDKIFALKRNAECYEMYCYDPDRTVWERCPNGPAWSDALGYGQAEVYSTIRTHTIKINGQDKLLALIRNGREVELHQFDPGSNQWSQLTYLPKWTNAEGFNQADRYETFKTEVLTIKDKSYLIAFIRNGSYLEGHLYDPANNQWSALPEGPKWDNNYQEAQYYRTFRTLVISSEYQGTSHQVVIVGIRNTNYYELHAYDHLTQTWQELPHGPKWSNTAQDGYYTKPNCYEYIHLLLSKQATNKFYLGILGKVGGYKTYEYNVYLFLNPIKQLKSAYMAHLKEVQNRGEELLTVSDNHSLETIVKTVLLAVPDYRKKMMDDLGIPMGEVPTQTANKASTSASASSTSSTSSSSSSSSFFKPAPLSSYYKEGIRLFNQAEVEYEDLNIELAKSLFKEAKISLKNATDLEALNENQLTIIHTKLETIRLYLEPYQAQPAMAK